MMQTRSVGAMALVECANHMVQELVDAVWGDEFTLEQALQIVSIAQATLLRLQPDRKRAVEAVLEASATLQFLEGQMIHQ